MDQEVTQPAEPSFYTWARGDEAGRAAALYNSQRALARVEPVVRAHGSNIYLNVAPQSVSIRDDVSRRDYDDFRPDRRLPTEAKAVIKACMDAYKKIGLVRNVIDLMADFATQGIDVVHPNERIEKWHKGWFRKVGGKDRSERFLNLLYRTGVAIPRRRTAFLPVEVEEAMRRAHAKPDMKVTDLEPSPPSRREIPWKYNFLNPLSLEVLNDELHQFVGPGSIAYGLKIPRSLARRVESPRTPAEQDLIGKLPPDLLAAVRRGDAVVPLDPNKVRGFHYKRDDWELWASPMVEAILGDLEILQKMKLADVAALDGAISCIRVWKLGSEDLQILPGPAAINRLAEMLCNNVGGGVMDLVWDFAIDLIETSTDVHRFLGNSKYESTLTAIYAGLGIPPTLTGADSKGGFTNNFISLKTLTERLQYGRDVLSTFWEEELALVQKAMGFRFPARITFDRMVLSDEAAEKQLLLHMWDRNLISDETIQERFAEIPEIERVRTRRESRKRKDGLLPDKASPFHISEKEHELRKLFVQNKTVTPSEVGLDLEERKPGEESPIETETRLAPKAAPGQTKPKGQPGQGRPKGKKDSQKRKKRTVKPRVAASLMQSVARAENALAQLAKVAGKALTGALGKANLKELTDQETRGFEDLKFRMLFRLEEGREVTEDFVARASSGDLSLPLQVEQLLKATVDRHRTEHGREPRLEELRLYQAGVYGMWQLAPEEEEE